MPAPLRRVVPVCVLTVYLFFVLVAGVSADQLDQALLATDIKQIKKMKRELIGVFSNTPGRMGIAAISPCEITNRPACQLPTV